MASRAGITPDSLPGATSTPGPLTALWGDSWRSPHFCVALSDPDDLLVGWTVRAQARRDTEADDVTFEWTTPGGGIVLGQAEVRLRDGRLVTTGAIQLLLRPADWDGKPRRWRGVLDVEISSDDTANPEERHTVVQARPFVVRPDTAR